MKNRSLYRIIAFLLSLVMLSSFSLVPSYAEPLDGVQKDGLTVFRIELHSQDNTIKDYSSVVFHVYSARLSSVDEECGIEQYEESFAFDSHADANGVVEFKRPSDCFSVTLDLDTVPKGYGAIKETEFFQSETHSSVFEISAIDHVRSSATSLNTIEDFIPYDANNNELYAVLESSMVIDSREFSSLVFSEKLLVVPFLVSSGRFNQNATAVIDISATNRFERLSYLYDEGYITNEEKISRYCDVILSGDFENVSCIEGYVDEIAQYTQSKNSTKEIEEKAERIFQRPVESDRALTDIPTYNQTYSSTNFKIHYNSSICSYSKAVAIASHLETVRTKYLNMGFSAPILESGSTKYNVYITQDAYAPDEDTLANCFQTEVMGNKSASYIVVYKFNNSSVNNQFKEVLGHEYFHAVQNAYNRTSGWFKEACATWGGEKTLGHDDFSGPWLHNYLQNDSYKSVYDIAGYECYFLPFCIEKDYGGISTLIEFYTLYSSCSYGCSNTVLMNTVTTALHNKGYTSASFEKVFEKCAVYNAYPESYYKPVYEASITNPFPKCMEQNASSYNPGSKTIYKLGCLYYKFVPFPSFESTLSITVTVSNSNVKCKYVRTIDSSTNNRVIGTPTLSSLRYTIVRNNFGNHYANEFVVIPYCLNTSGGTVSVSATKKANIYKITNTGTGKVLNIYGDNLTSINNNQNVTLWTSSGSNEQKWYIPSIGNGVYIRTIIDPSYGINVHRVGSPWNCDLYPIIGNETDAQVDFISVSGGYKIKLHNYDLYLSAAGSSNGSNVYWSASSSSLYQTWSLTPVT